MKSRQFLFLGLLGALSLIGAACGGQAGGTSVGPSTKLAADVPSGPVNGAGSSFAAPFYQQWGNNVEGLTLNYQPVGSGAGVAQFQSGNADFGASDPPLTAEDKQGANKGKPVQIPTGFGAITAAYNLQGVESGIKLDGPILAAIFMGKIKNWNDPAIKRLNPQKQLPNQGITVIHRSDESGTTKGFTQFLAETSPEWKSQIGSDKTVKWPTGTGAKGNAGVAAAVKQQPGSIGYVEQAYALQNNFTTATVKNRSGNFVEPTLGAVTAAGEGVEIPPDLGLEIINSPNPQAYPIASQTFMLVYKDLCKAGLSKPTAQRVKAFVDYGLGGGQEVLSRLQYAKLPPQVLAKAKQAAGGLQCNGQPVGGGQSKQ